MNSEDELLQIVRTISNHILSYFQVNVLAYNHEKELRPWLKYGSQNINALKAFIQANQYNYRGEGHTAEKYLRSAIQLDSTFISPRIWLISKLVEKGKIQEASEHHHCLIALQARASPFEQVMIDWAGACVHNDIALQARYLTIALDYSPQNNILLFSLARLRYIMEDYPGSIEALTNIIKTKLQYSPVYYLLGANYYQLEKNDEARVVLEKSLSIRPVEPNIYSLLARLWIENADTSKAQHYEDLYINCAKNRGIPSNIMYAHLAYQNYNLARYDKAITYFRLTMTYEKNSPDIHKGLADALYQQGYTEEAIKEYLQTLKLNASCTDSHFMLGQIFEKRKEINKAVFHYRAYLELDSVSTNVALVKKYLKRLQK
jgi:tetratricopeptide (TPR) repeat protein